MKIRTSTSQILSLRKNTFYPRALFCTGSKYGIAVPFTLLLVFQQLRLMSVRLSSLFTGRHISQPVNSSDIRDTAIKCSRTASFQPLLLSLCL
jgi:hypothetical protein